MEILAARFAADHPRTNAGWSVQLVPLREELVRSSRTELLLVFGAVFGLLLLVCANVASLAIARGAARAREMAIRFALGAGRTRIVREHLAETALCAVLTALAAIVFTTASLGAAIAFAPSDIPRLQEVEINATVVSFAMALSILVTIVGVFLPGLRGGSTAIASALKDGAPVSGQNASRIRRALVVAEIAVTVVLLVGAGLLARSFAGLMRVDPGFDAQHLLVLRIAPDATRYETAPVRNDYYRRVLDSIRELPGVASAAAVTVLPMSTIGSDFYRPYWLEGARPSGNAEAQANVRMATPGVLQHAWTAARVGPRVLSSRRTRCAARDHHQRKPGSHRVAGPGSCRPRVDPRLPGRRNGAPGGRRRPRCKIQRPSQRSVTGDLHSARAEPLSDHERGGANEDRPGSVGPVGSHAGA